MTLEEQVHNLEVRVRKLEEDKKQLLIRIENLEGKLNSVVGTFGNSSIIHK